ncbi:MAG: hypothetical protein ACAH11_11655 [Sphingomonas sp.]
MTEGTVYAKEDYEHHVMEHSSPYQFDAKRVIHRVLDINDTGGKFEFFYKKPLQAYCWPQEDRFESIDELVAHLATKPVNGTEEKYPEDGPLIIPVKSHAYVVIELAPRLPWRFAPGAAGITLGKLQDGGKLKHGDLQHYPKDDASKPQHTAPKNCRFAYFSTLVTAEGADQALNFNLIDGNGSKFSVDPDIRYPGTGGDVGDGP